MNVKRVVTKPFRSGARTAFASLSRHLTPIQRWKLQVFQATWNSLKTATATPRACPICNYLGLFQPFGWSIRPEAQCPSCGSLERHRLFKLWLDQDNYIVKGKRVLHFAPDALSQLLRPSASEYVTADIDGTCDLTVNIEDMREIPDGRFDVVVSAHVLEHVDDAAALKEMRRVLAPEGTALIMTPVIEGWSRTFEDAGITDPQERTLYFGQSDHSRLFGSDIRQRIADAGFIVSEFTAEGRAVSQHGLYPGEKLFICCRH